MIFPLLYAGVRDWSALLLYTLLVAGECANRRAVVIFLAKLDTSAADEIVARFHSKSTGALYVITNHVHSHLTLVI